MVNSEIEAAEACKWLRAAGFPQYAQMYEDLQFPIDVCGVQNDHPFLDADSLQSLFRRLTALNRCAAMKLEHHHKHGNDSDDETECALSAAWQYERKSRRWSRVVDITPAAQRRLQALAARALAAARDGGDSGDETGDEPLPVVEMLMPEGAARGDLLTVPGQPPIIKLPDQKDEDDEATASRFRRTGSERLRDGAKAFLRRVESLKTRRRKRQNRTEVIISSPHQLDVVTGPQERTLDLNCLDISPTSHFPFADFSTTPSPIFPARTQPPSPNILPSPTAPVEPNFLINSMPPFGDDSSSYCSDGSLGSTHKLSTKSKIGTKAKRFLHRGLKDDSAALSDSECQPASWRHNYFKDNNSNHTEVYVEPPSPIEGTPTIAVIDDEAKSPSHAAQRRHAIRGGSLNLGKEGQKFRDKVNLKRDKSASRSSDLDGSPNSTSSRSHDDDGDDESVDIKTRHKGSVQRWCSFRTNSLNGQLKSGGSQSASGRDPENYTARQMSSLSCGQLHVLRKLALLRLTACMERYCPSHKSGWNWELPKLIRKIKTPDYKDKTVFGVPLTISLQRTGHALPKPIQHALIWLKNNALDQMGIFRKAGVKSRIARLRTQTETAGTTAASIMVDPNPIEGQSASGVSFDGAQAHDVADMVKQYFRELPDSLLTNKLSETFIAIFQHVPEPLRPDAVQCALLLLPEEHLEALQSVLGFLYQVAEHSSVNQMTASNLAVCLAPTLLRLHHTTSSHGSTKEGNSNRGSNETVGNSADQRQISESRAAHACLLLLIQKHKTLFTAPADMLARCKFNHFEESVPVALEELGQDFNQDWKGFQQTCIKALLKEAREKSRGWMSVSGAAPHVELCCKKVGDGHPLRLWRCTTDVEAPPQEVMHRILRERHIWDDTLLKWRIVEKLGPTAEVFQYISSSATNLPARDYCVLRSWQTSASCCAVAETSVQHGGAPPPPVGGARGVVLASRYLVEPAGKGRSRLVHLARVDTMGRTPEWYNKCYGHICALFLARLRASFKHNTEGPESNV